MRARLPLLIAVAGTAAIGAVFLARNWLDDRRAEFAALQDSQPVQVDSIDTIEVLIAQEGLEKGTFLTMDQFDWTAFPDDNIPESYLTRADLAKTAEELGFPEDPLEGAVIRSALTAGEPLTVGRIIRPGDRGFLAAVLRPGHRAVSVPVDATTGIAGFVFPGDRVDLLLTHEIELPNGDARYATETVLVDLRVLAVDQRTNDLEVTPTIAKTATLEVTPTAAEVIAVALRMGRLSLALRALATFGDAPATAVPPPGDAAAGRAEPSLAAEGSNPLSATQQTSVQRGYTWDSQASRLLARIRTPRAAAPTPADTPPPPKTVTIVRNGEAQQVSFSARGPQ